jgi:hypothetical protein
MKKSKDFDSVEMMREIRDQIHKKFENNPELRKKNLEEVRAKYGIKKKSTVKHR